MSVSTDNPVFVVLEYKRKSFGDIEGRSDRSWADVYGPASDER